MKLLLSALLPFLASAGSDSTYYLNGMTSPNADQKMFWAEGTDVLKDLSQFQSLYVTYHNCAWETPTGDEEGGGGNEGDDWYLGTVPSFRANVAFTLYGTLKGEKDTGCNKKTFINSFHTTQGLESFTNAMASAGLTNLFELYDGDGNDDAHLVVTSNCYEDEDGGEGDDAYYNGDKMYSTTSYGLGCAADGSKTFAIHTYQGSTCDANAINSTLDELEDLNERLGMSKCVPIYKDGDYYNAEEGGGEDNSSPLAILESSRTCRLHDGSKSCPDPYKVLRVYERNLLKATESRYFEPYWNKYRVQVVSMTMIILGGILFLAAIVAWAMDLCLEDPVASEKKKERKEKKSRKSSKKSKSKKAEKMSRQRSDHSESLISQISQTLGFGAAAEAAEEKTKPSSKDRRSNSKSSKSTNRSSKSTRSNQVDKDIALEPSSSYRSELSAVSDLDDHTDDESVEIRIPDDPPAGSHSYENENTQTEEYTHTEDYTERDFVRTPSIASDGIASVASAVNDMVHFFKNKADEVFADEWETDHEAMMTDNEGLPHSAPSKGVGETEVTGQEEKSTKKRYRKRQWFKKLLFGSSSSLGANKNKRDNIV